MGTVTGPVSSTDTAIARWNGTSGTVIQDSTVTIDGSGNITGVANIAGSPTTTTQSFDDNSTKIATTEYVDTAVAELRTLNTIGFTTGRPIIGKQTGYFTCPYTAQIISWSFAVDAGTATVKTWKSVTGTSSPTSADSISTAGVSISSGTAIKSTTLTDFSVTDVTAGDVVAFELTAFSGCSEITFQLELWGTLHD